MSDNSDLEMIAFQDLPHHLALDLLKYNVTMIGVDRAVKKGFHQGSGTFVKTGDRHYILTAGHCADWIQPYKEMGLAISGNEDGTTHEVPKPIYIAPWERFGPDMAFLPLSPDTVNFISNTSTKAFYDLDQHRADMLKGNPKVDFGLWVLAGSPVLLSDTTGKGQPLKFLLMGYSVGVEEALVEKGYDYIDVRIALDGPNVLQTFVGVSGGGLWQAELRRSEDQSIVFASEPRLEGCVFTEINTENSEYRRIRSHSRKSIYEIGIAKLQEAEGG